MKCSWIKDINSKEHLLHPLAVNSASWLIPDSMVFTMCPGPPWEKMTYMVFGAALTRSWQKGFTNISVGMIWKGLVGSLQDLDGFGANWHMSQYHFGMISPVWFCDWNEDEPTIGWQGGVGQKLQHFLNLSVQKVTEKFKDQERKYSQVHNLSDIIVHMLWKRVLEKFSILFHFSCCICLRQKKSVQQRASQ